MLEGTHEVSDEAETRELGARLGAALHGGDVVFLHGSLGAGKTTLVRGLLQSLGVREPVRSPTFNLLQAFDTNPPVLHADLYRVKSYEGIGLEDYLDTHVLLIEWPDRAEGLISDAEVWHVHIDFAPAGRKIRVQPPVTTSRA